MRAAGPALGDHDAVRAEASSTADDGAEVARVGHVVDRDDQRLLGVDRRGVEKVVGVGVLVGRDARGQALVDTATDHPVHLGLRDLEQLDALVGRELEGLPQPAVALGALGDVERVDRHALTQGLDDRVAADDPLGVARCAPLRLGRGGLLRTLRDLVGLVVLAVLGLRRRALALETTLDPSSGPGGRVALAGLLDRALALRIACHQAMLHFGPSGVSSTSMPAALIRSRIASAVAKSLSARACARCSRSPATRASTASVSRSSSPLPPQAGSAGCSPSTSSIASTCAAYGAASSALLPSRTVS